MRVMNAHTLLTNNIFDPNRPYGRLLPMGRVLLLCLLSLIMACGGGANTETSESSSGGDDESWDDDWGDDEEVPTVESNHGAIEALGITPPEEKPWEEMNAEEREWYMIGKVLPIMKEVFGEHDAARWSPESYGCETCHGESGAEDAYVMPTSAMFPVPEAGTPAYDNMRRIFGDMVTFMEERVTPVMGTLLGVEDYSCAHCHPTAQ